MIDTEDMDAAYQFVFSLKNLLTASASKPADSGFEVSISRRGR